MEIGFDKLKQQLKRRGRKYFGGLLHGLGLGFLIGTYFGAHFSGNFDLSWTFRMILFIGVAAIIILGHAVFGSPKKNEELKTG